MSNSVDTINIDKDWRQYNKIQYGGVNDNMHANKITQSEMVDNSDNKLEIAQSGKVSDRIQTNAIKQGV